MTKPIPYLLTSKSSQAEKPIRTFESFKFLKFSPLFSMPSMLFVLDLSTNLSLLIIKKAGDMTLFPVLNIDRGRRRRGDLVTAGHTENPISK